MLVNAGVCGGGVAQEAMPLGTHCVGGLHYVHMRSQQ